MYNVIFYNNDLSVNHSKSNLHSLKIVSNRHFEKRDEFLFLIGDFGSAKKLNLYGEDNVRRVICDASNFKPSSFEKPFSHSTEFVSMDLSDVEKSTELVSSFKGQPLVSFSDDERLGLFENTPANINPSNDFLVSMVKEIPDDLSGDLSNVLYEMPLKSLKSLRNGSFMFKKCYTFEEFNYDLPKLEEAFQMFAFTNIKKWNKSIPKLEYAGPMLDFKLVIKLMELGLEDEDITIDDLLQSEDGLYILFMLGFFMVLGSNCGMFHECENLESFCGDLSSLICGTCMFAGCSSLTSFRGDLSNLRYGLNMFGPSVDGINGEEMGVMYYDNAPRLDAESVMHILFSLSDLGDVDRFEIGEGYEEYDSFLKIIKDLSEGIISLGINATENTKDDFAQEIGFDNFDALNEAFRAKNWIVHWHFVNNDNEEESSTYNLRRNVTQQSNKVYTKLTEIKPNIELKERVEKLFNIDTKIIDKMINFQSEDGSKLYHLMVINETNSPESYDKFDSLEEAIAFYNIVPRKIEK